MSFDHYFTLIDTMLIKQEKWLDAARSLLVTANRYGWTQELIDFGKAKILPFLHLDLAYTFLGNQNPHEKLHDEISNALSHPVSEPMQKRWIFLNRDDACEYLVQFLKRRNELERSRCQK